MFLPDGCAADTAGYSSVQPRKHKLFSCPCLKTGDCNTLTFSLLKCTMNSPQSNLEWAALAADVLAGEQSAVQRMSDVLSALAYKYYRRAGLSHHDAEDLAQEVVIRVITHLRQFDGRNFVGWAFEILRTVLAGYYRQRKRQVPTRPLFDSDWEIATQGPAHNGLLTETEHAALEEAIQRLQEKDRRLVESQTGYQKASFKQMARELEITEGNARQRYYRAKEEIEATLRHDPRMKVWIAHH